MLRWLSEGQDIGQVAARLQRPREGVAAQFARLLAQLGAGTAAQALQALESSPRAEEIAAQAEEPLLRPEPEPVAAADEAPVGESPAAPASVAPQG